MGGWMSPVHGLVEEPVSADFTDDYGLNRLGEVEEFAVAVAEAFGQEAVTIEIDNSLQFVGALAPA